MTMVVTMMAMKIYLPKRGKRLKGQFFLSISLIYTSHDRHPRRRDRDYQSYLELVKLIPTLKDRITDPHGGARMLYYARVSRLSASLQGLTHPCSLKLLDCANNARSDDTARVKPIIASLLNNRANNPANPPLDLETRDARGLQNDFTGRLLCPIIYDWEDLA